MLRLLFLALVITFGAKAQTTDVDLYKRLQNSVNLPLISKSAPPNQAYEARLYIKSGDPVYIIEIASDSGSKHFFTLDSASDEAKSIVGAKHKSNGQAIIFKHKDYQFVCSFGFYVVD